MLKISWVDKFEDSNHPPGGLLTINWESLILEPKEFVFENFNELFMNDESYALRMFFFLERLMSKIDNKENLGIFNDIYKKGADLLKMEDISSKEVIDLLEQKESSKMGLI